MDKIVWCLKEKKGLEFVKPNDNLAYAYLKKAEEALESMRSVKNKDWKISTTYYAMYFSLYAILMRIGIKCEIHSCTIEFMKRFLSDFFSREECSLLKNSLKARIDTQYYVNREVSDELYNAMIKKAPEFFVKCKSIVSKLDERRIKKRRELLKKSFGSLKKVKKQLLPKYS